VNDPVLQGINIDGQQVIPQQAHDQAQTILATSGASELPAQYAQWISMCM
jgi:hypothetical protein